MRRALYVLMSLLAISAVAWTVFGDRAPDQSSLVGAYLSEDGEIFVLSERSAGCLQYTSESGKAARVCLSETGTYQGASDLDGTGSDDLRLSVLDQAIQLDWQSKGTLLATSVDVDRLDVVFQAEEAILFGQLLAPKKPEKLNLAVIVQGSSRSSAVLRLREQHFLAAKGVAAFVYDKRGTGRSQGQYTQDFGVLARDAARAMEEARDLLGDRVAKSGFVGLSQGGWVAPLAADSASADFVAIGYGLAVSPAEEERSEIMARVATAGFDLAAIKTAGELADETVALAATDFKGSTELYERLKAEAASQGWLEVLPDDNITGQISAYPVAAVRWLWRFFDVDTSWFHNARSALDSLDIPQLWLIGGWDEEAPPERTLEILAELAQRNPELHVEVFGTAGHEMIERSADGSNPRQRYAQDYIPTLMDFVRRQ